ncbi:hypothetical protein F4775DRAFT_505857 [Biscogniauxia sp. FL1348]|nr:hypothetical protein F4775DRAFT_505857 [Biscogniauxia sp. FL1348]
MAHSPSGGEVPLDLKRELIEAIDSLFDEAVEVPPNVHNAIEKWLSVARSSPAKTSYLLYHLVESSQEKAFAMEALSPGDLARYRCLERLGARHNFTVFLSRIEKQVGGTMFDMVGNEMEEGHEMEEEVPVGTINDAESEWSVQVLFDTCNGWKTPKLALDSHGILQGDIFEGCEPDEEGDPAEYYDEPQDPHLRAFVHYHRSLGLAIVPQSMIASFLASFTLKHETILEGNSLIKHFASKCKVSGSDDRPWEILTKLCSELFPQQDSEACSDVKFPEETIARVLEVALRAQNQGLFETVCKNIEVDLSPQFFVWIAESARETSLPFGMLQPALERTIFAAPRLGDRYTKILSLNTFNYTAPPALREVVLAILDKVVDRCLGTDPLFEQDGETLVFMASAFRDYSWLLKKICPVVYQRRKDYAFVMGFSWQLYTNIRQNKLQVHDSFEYLKFCLRTLLQEIDVSLLLSVTGFVRWQGQRRTQPKMPPPRPPITKETLTNLCIILLELGMERYFLELVTQLTDQIQRIDPPEFIDLYLPFIRDLMVILEKYPGLLQELVVSSIFRTIILACWDKYVGEAPRPSENGQAISSWQARVMEARGELGRFDQKRLSEILGADYYTLLGTQSSSMCPPPQWQNAYAYPPLQNNMLPAAIPAHVASYGQSIPPAPPSWRATHRPFAGATGMEMYPANPRQPSPWGPQSPAAGVVPGQQPYVPSQPIALPDIQRTLASSPRMPLASIPQNSSWAARQNGSAPTPPYSYSPSYPHPHALARSADKQVLRR